MPEDDRKPPPGSTEDETESLAEAIASGERIGPYRIVRKIGEGGMGEVYEAEQTEPIRRTVAVKVIKWGMDTRTVVARFEAERQALALMDHPGIARVLDAGATERGRPYFVMEYVKGERITRYCDRHRLTPRERLELFGQVCEGVQHAHQKAIIHRDLKPSNVLVTIQDGKPVPKIIDFGVAKATAQKLTEKTVYTEYGALIGTPEYMSPEQAEMTGLDVDTRTDVYSLGVLLYELLTGVLPFDPKELRRAGFDEIRRKIREEEPSRPSTRVTTLDEASTDSARKRRTNPAGLARLLRGDLDWITMNALEKDRTRRYSTPSELAADIDRYLRDEPVSAGPPGGIYRLRKFVRRHKAAVLVGALLGLATWVGIAGLAYGAAEKSYVDSARRAGQLRFYARSFWGWDNDRNNDYLVALFDSSRFDQPAGSVTAKEVLDRAVRELPADIDLDKGLNAWILSHRVTLLGRLYMSLGYYEDAEPLLRNALEIRSTHLSGMRYLVLESLEDCAKLYAEWGRETDAAECRSRAEAYSDEHHHLQEKMDWTDPLLDGVKRELRKLDGKVYEGYEFSMER